MGAVDTKVKRFCGIPIGSGKIKFLPLKRNLEIDEVEIEGF